MANIKRQKQITRDFFCASLYNFLLSGALLNITILLLRRIFIIFLNIMITHYIKNSIVEENILFHIMWCQNIFVKKYIYKIIWKHTNIYFKWFKWFLTFMKVEHILNHVIHIVRIMFVRHVKNSRIFISKKWFNKKKHNICVVNWNFDK
jgi:hypothetical protein